MQIDPAVAMFVTKSQASKPVLLAAVGPLYVQEQRPILAIAVGFRGMAAMRAVLNWAPVQAHATSHKVTCYYVTKSPAAAAFIQEWDTWREAGVSIMTSTHPCLLHHAQPLAAGLVIHLQTSGWRSGDLKCWSAFLSTICLSKVLFAL